MRRLKRNIRRTFLNLFYRRLWVRIAVILMLIALVPVVLLGVLLINTSQEAVRNSVLSNHKLIVIRAAEEIELFIKRPQDILAATASMLGVVYPAPWKQETILVELVLNQPIFMRACSIDASGQELATSELGSQKQEYSKVALDEALKGRIYVSSLKVLQEEIPFVTMGVPIRKLGKVIGALVAEINVRGLWDMVENIRIGKTGRAFLVTNDGTLIAHPDKKRVLRNENLGNQKEVQLVLSGRTEAIESEDPQEGKVISSYAPIQDLGWGIVLSQRQDEAYRFSKVMRVQSWIIILLSGLAAIIVSLCVGKGFASPIKALAERIKSVAAGDLNHKIKIRMRDELGELSRSFNEMNKKLRKARERERLSAIGEAVTWISHELKNSIVAIKSFVQLFPSRHKDEQFVNRFSRLVPEEIRRLEQMFKELSDFVSYHELRLSKVNLKKVMDDVLEIMREEFLAKKISLQYSPINGNFHIDADAQRLRQVFINLVINCMSAMPEGGILAVSMSLIERGGLNTETSVEIRISDTGKGIPQDALGRIFEPFRTTKNGGMGLGLTISRKIIKQHAGDISIESQLNKGTTFIVRLPITAYGELNVQEKDFSHRR